MASSFEKTEVKLIVLNDINMLKKCTRGEICHPIHQYAEVNNKYMKDCDKKQTHL